MTRGGIISMAREAGAPDWWSGADDANVPGRHWLARFAAMVAAKEREACANVCEERAGSCSLFMTKREALAHAEHVRGCAAAIRARGEQQ